VLFSRGIFSGLGQWGDERAAIPACRLHKKPLRRSEVKGETVFRSGENSEKLLDS